MTTRAARAWNVYRRGGLLSLLRAIDARISERMASEYRDRVRPRMPLAGHAVWNGVLVAEARRRFDSIVPPNWKPVLSGDDPTYEGTLVAGLNEHVAAGDRVVVVGGGFGVTVVAAARRAGAGGHVTCFEAAQERIADLQTALRLNRPPAPVSVEHAIVAEAISLFGSAGAARRRRAEEPFLRNPPFPGSHGSHQSDRASTSSGQSHRRRSRSRRRREPLRSRGSARTPCPGAIRNRTGDSAAHPPAGHGAHPGCDQWSCCPPPEPRIPEG